MSDPTREHEIVDTSAVTTDDTPAPESEGPAPEVNAVASPPAPATPTAKAAVEAGHVVSGAGHTAEEPFDEDLPTVDPTRPSLTQSQITAGITEIECPSCHTLWQGNDLRPHAAWFCRTVTSNGTPCGFPLFWAHAAAHTETPTDDSLHRLPGTDGRVAPSFLDCPKCGEQNPPDPTANCLRCGHPLTQPEPHEQRYELIQVAVASPVIEPRRRRIWPWILATGSLALIAVILLIILIVND